MTEATTQSTHDKAAAALAWLERRGTASYRDGLARYGIFTDKAFGVSVDTTRQYAKTLGRDHELALALWDSGWLEAQMLAVFIDDPKRVTPAQMDRWCRTFGNWGICDTACFHLFDKTPHAYGKVSTWAGRKGEFVKRAGFALLASLALHDKKAPDAAFTKFLPLIRRAASDDRNFVKKGVSWALRSIGHRNPGLRAEALRVAERLAKSKDATERWVGKDAVKDLSRPARRKAGQPV